MTVSSHYSWKFLTHYLQLKFISYRSSWQSAWHTGAGSGWTLHSFNTVPLHTASGGYGKSHGLGTRVRDVRQHLYYPNAHLSQRPRVESHNKCLPLIHSSNAAKARDALGLPEMLRSNWVPPFLTQSVLASPEFPSQKKRCWISWEPSGNHADPRVILLNKMKPLAFP